MIKSFELPKVTIITVVFNAEKFIENTILSIINQNYPNFEYIIIDGGSSDGTIEVIKKYEDKIAFWSSDLDEGIYHAMNKGLMQSSGSWINFMNAGDAFYSSNTLTEIFNSAIPDVKIIYGGVEILYPEFSRVQMGGDPKNLWRGMQFSHQSAFVSGAYHRMHLFDSANKIAADLAFFYQAYLGGVGFYNSNQVISKVVTGGVSETNRLRAIMSSCEAVCAGRLRLLIRLYYVLKLLDSLMRSFAKHCLPSSLVRFFILRK